MAIEIGSLVVKGRFGPAARDGREARAETEARLARMQREILEDVREMLAEAAHRPLDR